MQFTKSLVVVDVVKLKQGYVRLGMALGLLICISSKCLAIRFLPDRQPRARRYKYIHMEEMLGNVPGARQIFERWMAFEPDHHGWMAYIKAWSLSRRLSHP